MNFTTSLIPNVYNLTIKANDSYFTVLRSYQFDFNDGCSVVFLSNGILNNVYKFDHTFPGGGFYDVNITVFNLVSTVSRIIRASQLLTLKHNLYLN